MAFQYTFRADDISTWDVDTRDLVENRDRELELYASTIDSSFLNLNADNLTSGTVPSSRVTGSYTGITQVGTLSAGVASYSIGDTGPSGGKVFITPSTSGNTTGLYFEVAPVSAEVQRTWSQFAPINYTSTSVPLAQFNNIGTGKSNTVAIVNQGNSNPDTCAAKYCDDFTYGGYSDWFLPSKDELNQMYVNRVALNTGFSAVAYWSSSEVNANSSWLQNMSTGFQANFFKSSTFYVRPVRSFSTIGLNVIGSAVVRTAATQDGVILAGRAGGTSDYAVSILPTTLTANRTLTLPDVTGTAITTGNLSSITAVGTLASGSIPASLLTGTTLPATIVTSSLTSVGTITTGTWSGSFGAVSGANLTNLNASNLASGAVPGGRLSGSYTGITGVGTLSAGSIPATLLTGTVASARLSGAYTGITQLGTISPSLTVTGGTGTTITATTQTLINGTNNNAGIYLGGSTGSSSTGGIEASWRDAANPSIAIGVTRDNNRTMTVHSYADSTIRFYAGNSNEALINNGGFTANHYYGVVQYGSYGSLSVYGESAGWYGIVFPSQATTWMSAANGQYFGCYRNNTTWNFYVINGTFTPSDERYKRDIEPLQHGMNLIREIVPVTFDPLTEDPADDPEQTVGRTHYGFTTQNILQALANAGETRDVAIVDIGGPANESNESDRQYLNHSALIAPMVKAIQELDARLQQLETV